MWGVVCDVPLLNPVIVAVCGCMNNRGTITEAAAVQTVSAVKQQMRPATCYPQRYSIKSINADCYVFACIALLYAMLFFKAFGILIPLLTRTCLDFQLVYWKLTGVLLKQFL